MPGRRFWLGLWAGLFVMACTVGLGVQLVALPYLFPAWHAGHGLLAGGDWLYFHDLAQQLARKIADNGWRAWELRPEGQAPAGVLAAAYALTGISEPWVAVPLYAALYATGGIFLWLVVTTVLGDERRALWCLIPYVLLPSAIMLYAQPHKDAWQVAGFFAFVYGWLLLACPGTWQNRGLAGTACAAVFAGACLSWMVRPYCVEMMQGISIFFAAGFSIRVLANRVQPKMTLRCRTALIILAWTIVVMMTPFTKGPGEGKSLVQWRESGWLPSFVDGKLWRLADSREHLRLIEATGNIDDQVSFHSAADVFLYLPRAAQIGFLSPFPRHWFEPGSTGFNTVFRRVAGLEMIVAYLALGSLLIFGWRMLKASPELGVALCACTAMIIIYALTVPNIGGLYRYRWGYMAMLFAFGCAAFLRYRDSAHRQGVGKSNICIHDGEQAGA